MDNNYYKEYFTLERTNWWFIVRNKIIILLIDKSLGGKKQNLKVLNVGAATGRTSEMLGKYGEVTSLEYNQECCDFVKAQLGFEITNGTILDLSYEDNYFDLVCAFDVIEHVEEDAAGLAEMKRVCKVDGLLALTVPAFMSLWSTHDVVNHHFRRYTKTNFVQLFKDIDLQPKFVTYFNTILFIPIFMYRAITTWLPKTKSANGAGSDATVGANSKFLNYLLNKIFSIELFLLKFIKFPFGVSIFITTTKK